MPSFLAISLVKPSKNDATLACF